METIFEKTNHFWQRAWERGIHQKQIDCLLSGIIPPKGKSIMIFGKKKLAEASIKLNNKSHLIIIVKGRVLITLFPVPDLFQYMQANKNVNFILI